MLFNEEDRITECYQAIKDLLRANCPVTIASTYFATMHRATARLEILKAIAAEDPSVKIIVNSRNRHSAQYL